jgi:hypothetical protein
LSHINIEAFDCHTSTGESSTEFWSALCSSENGIQKTNTENWPEHFQNFWKDQPYAPIACKIKTDLKLSDLLAKVGANCLKGETKNLGIILSTTKGALEEYVWKENFKDLEIDPLNVLLEETIAKLPVMNWKLTQVVSNSCTSGHASMALAQKWIQSGACEKVLVLAGDLIGPFIHAGFQSLKALSSSSGKPFQEARDGLVLGEAVTAILLSNQPAEFELVDVKIFNEAHTITGPSPEGRGLQTCVKELSHHHLIPDFAIAHGTATFLNDQTEDFVLNEAQKIFNKPFFITGTKWSIGHTLGASGCIDLIAAMLCLRHQKVFAIPGTAQQTGFLAKNYVFEAAQTGHFQTALVTSLGFGGTNGALMVKKVKV